MEGEGSDILVGVFAPLVVEREGLSWAGSGDVLFMELRLDLRLPPISSDASSTSLLGRGVRVGGGGGARRGGESSMERGSLHFRGVFGLEGT